MAGALLARRPLNQAPQPTIVFERICAESFLYHSTLLMLFEPSLDVLCRVNPPVNFTRYFASLESGEVKQPRISASTQPVLDASYEFFLTIADVTRLARIARPLDKTEVEMWERLQGDLLQWEGTVLNDPCRMLYLLAMHILLLKVDPRMSLCRRTERIYGLLQLGLSAIDRLDVHKSLQGYLLWPLAVLGSVTIDNNVRCIIEKKLSLLSQTRHGLVMRVKKRIEMIWDSQEGDKEIVMLRRLRMLVEGI